MIYLKYLTTAMSFEELDWKPAVSSAAITGATLRGHLFEHPQYARRGWTITISADAIDDDTGFDFLTAFFLSNARQLSFNGTDYVNVQIEPGELPLTFIENIRFLPEITFTLHRKEPIPSAITGEDIFNALP